MPQLAARVRLRGRRVAPTTRKIETNQVTDPSSVALTLNSTRSVAVAWTTSRKAVDLGDQPEPAAAPARGLDDLRAARPRLLDQRPDRARPRDRGTYLAFTDATATACSTCATLAARRADHRAPAADLRHRHDPRGPGRAGRARACDLAVVARRTATSSRPASTAVAATDGFNWGYDPLHYTAPEGSYARRPDGRRRAASRSSARWSARMHRRRPAGGHGRGLQPHHGRRARTPQSVLDRVVPGYYHRLDATGAVETSTCCPNTATEHAMGRSCMVDSVVTWAKRVQGRRLPLRPDGPPPEGEHAGRPAALDALTLRRDGVDGEDDLPLRRGLELRRGRRQRPVRPGHPGQLGGTGIGTFNDRLRDAVRGGGPFDDGPARSRASAPACAPTRTAPDQRHGADQRGAGCCTTRT